MEHSLGWVAQCKDSVEALRADIKQAKSQRDRCCQVLAAALAAQLALEHTVHLEGLNLRQAQALQQLCASTFAAIELAQQRVQVTGVRFSDSLMACSHQSICTYCMMHTALCSAADMRSRGTSGTGCQSQDHACCWQACLSKAADRLHSSAASDVHSCIATASLVLLALQCHVHDTSCHVLAGLQCTVWHYQVCQLTAEAACRPEI